MIAESFDHYDAHQATGDPLSVVLDGIVVDRTTTPRSYENFDIAWNRMTTYQKRAHGLKLCRVFFRDGAQVSYAAMCTPMIKKPDKEPTWILRKLLRKLFSRSS